MWICKGSDRWGETKTESKNNAKWLQAKFVLDYKKERSDHPCIFFISLREKDCRTIDPSSLLTSRPTEHSSRYRGQPNDKRSFLVHFAWGSSNFIYSSESQAIRTPFFSILPQRESNSNNDRFNSISNLASYMHGHLDALAKLVESGSSFHLRNSHNPSSIFVIDLVITK